MTETTPPPHEPDPLEPDVAGPARAPDVVDPNGPLDPVDEAASAAIDGLEPDDRAVAVDPARLDERVLALTRVTALLAEPVHPPEPSVIDTHIGAALAALDAGPAATGAEASPIGAAAPVEQPVGPTVASLAERRRRPAVGRWLAVAAAIAVVALAIPVVQSLSKTSTSSQDTASVAADAADSNEADPTAESPQPATSKSDRSSASSTTTSSSTDATVEPVSGANLGTAETPQALTALVQEAAPPDTAAGSTTSAESSTQATTTTMPSTRSLTHCDATNRASHPDLGALRYTATATYQSVPVEVAVYDVPDSTTASSRLIATAVDDCRVLLDQLLP